ncbi:ALI_collapsed_G0025410.mRNA.1.CDS.1 [Saccharomyces cerevisiae]|nr:ALI_collapsed_G0025410.mRNA.1.CDS.1 [Saccharomyces cerevisiae]
MVIPELHLDIQKVHWVVDSPLWKFYSRQVYEELESRIFTQTSDSMDEATKAPGRPSWEKVKFTVIMEDPLAGSYIQMLRPRSGSKHDYQRLRRTKEQNEDLGLSDIKVE